MEERTLKLELAKTKIGKVVKKDKEYSVLYGGILDIYETVGQIIPLEKEEYTDILVNFLLNEGKNYMIPSQDEIVSDRQKVLLPESLKKIVTKYKQDERVKEIKFLAKKQISEEIEETLSPDNKIIEMSKVSSDNKHCNEDRIETLKASELYENPDKKGISDSAGNIRNAEKDEKTEVENESAEPKTDYRIKESSEKLKKYAKVISVLGIVLTVIVAIIGVASLILVPAEIVAKLGSLVGSFISAASLYIGFDLTANKLINTANIETNTNEMVIAKLSTIEK